MNRYWVIVNTFGESWQYYGILRDAIEQYTDTHSIENIIALVSHD